MSKSSATGSAVRITASARAIVRLVQALFTWDATNPFNVHMSQMTNGQDGDFWAAHEMLNAIAKGVDESYQTWWAVECDFDERNIRALIKQAIANATVV